jgi:dihydrofolate reductase
MRKVILTLAATLDGFIEGPNGEIDWLVRDETIDFADILNGILDDKDAVFYGRVSYEKWGSFRPEKASEKLATAYDRLHSMQKYVFSRSRNDDGSGAIFISSDIAECVTKIKARPGKNIWLYGGGKLITTFLNLGLVDEFKLAVHPVIIGKGRPLFENIEARHKLRLISCEAHSSGVAQLHYTRKTD